MPYLINSIDKIAREMQRDVLYIRFHSPNNAEPLDEEISCFDQFFNAKALPIRKEIIAWLDKESIKWQQCTDMLSDGYLVVPYTGHIYIDVIYSENDINCKKLIDFMETPDGKMRYVDATLYCLPFNVACKNAHQDDPDFLENLFFNYEKNHPHLI